MLVRLWKRCRHVAGLILILVLPKSATPLHNFIATVPSYLMLGRPIFLIINGLRSGDSKAPFLTGQWNFTTNPVGEVFPLIQWLRVIKTDVRHFQWS
jgi:hypothetical protein